MKNTIMNGQLASFADVQDLMFQFEQVLRQHGIAVQPGSQLDRACLSVMDTLFQHQNPSARNELADVRPALSYALGLWEFAKKIVRLSRHPDFGVVVPHLRQMNDGGFLQNIKAGDRERTDQIPAKMFELLIALAAMDIGSNLELDDPDHPKGDNPDVITTISGLRWAFACKMMMGNSPISLFDRIEDGVKQIKRVAAPNGSIQRGVVVVSLKNRIDYHELWPILNFDQFRQGEPPLFGVQHDMIAIRDRLRQTAEQQMKAMEKSVSSEKEEEGGTPEKVLELFRGGVAIPVVLLFLQVTFATGDRAFPSVYHLLWPYRYGDAGAEDDAAFSGLYDALHNRFASSVPAPDGNQRP